MLVSKGLSYIWGATTIITIAVLLMMNMKVTTLFGYAVVSGIVFIVDSIQSQRRCKFSKVKVRWMIYMNIMQYCFWLGALIIIFIMDLSVLYELFVIADLFVLATFARVKFQHI